MKSGGGGRRMEDVALVAECKVYVEGSHVYSMAAKCL